MVANGGRVGFDGGGAGQNCEGERGAEFVPLQLMLLTLCCF